MNVPEARTERYYDAHDAVLQSFWDQEGVAHWGLFANGIQEFHDACQNLTRTMAAWSHIDASSTVLDVGCGNGQVDVELIAKYNCHVTGIDLSGVRIQNAIKRLEQQPDKIRNRGGFRKASASDLPFSDQSYSHVWSQSTIYHVPDKPKALQEMHRVLQDGGFLVMDDVFKPKPEVSEQTRKHFYDRLLFDTPFDLHEYQAQLEKTGFEIIRAEDHSADLKRSYQLKAEQLKEKLNSESNPELRTKYLPLIESYRGSADAVDRNEAGWALFLCRKRPYNNP